MINRFTYLSDGELDAQLEELARQLDVDAMLSDEDDGELAYGADEYDGQPDEYTEWQDVYGGDDWDHGQYDEF